MQWTPHNGLAHTRKKALQKKGQTKSPKSTTSSLDLITSNRDLGKSRAATKTALHPRGIERCGGAGTHAPLTRSPSAHAAVIFSACCLPELCCRCKRARSWCDAPRTGTVRTIEALRCAPRDGHNDGRDVHPPESCGIGRYGYSVCAAALAFAIHLPPVSSVLHFTHKDTHAHTDKHRQTHAHTYTLTPTHMAVSQGPFNGAHSRQQTCLSTRPPTRSRFDCYLIMGVMYLLCDGRATL
jgi:hypothetical protein